MAEVNGSGPEKKPLIFKSGSGFAWKGLNPDLDPQDLPPDTPRQLTNMRLNGGRIESRGGQQLIQTLVGPVNGMNDYNASYRPLLFQSEGSAEAYIISYDPTQSPALQRVVTDGSTFGAPGSMAIFGDDLYFSSRESGDADWSSLYKLRCIKPPYGTELVNISAGKQSIRIWGVPSPYDHITSLCVYDGELYIGVSDALGTTSAIYRYDGITAVIDTTFTYPIVAMSTFREKLIGFNDPTSPVDFIKVRTKAAAWSTVAGPGGAVPAVVVHKGSNEARSYRDKLYFCAGTNDSTYTWASFDGTTIVDLKAASGIGALGNVRSIEVFNGYLYFAWDDGASDTYIGRYDGTTWSPTHKKLTPQIDYGAPQTMISYNGNLYAAIAFSGSYAVKNIIHSAAENTSGTWTAIPITFSGAYFTTSSPSSSIVF